MSLHCLYPPSPGPPPLQLNVATSTAPARARPSRPCTRKRMFRCNFHQNEFRSFRQRTLLPYSQPTRQHTPYQTSSTNKLHSIRIEEDSHGVVICMRDTQTRDIVTLKKVKLKEEDHRFPITALREVNVLMTCRHGHPPPRPFVPTIVSPSPHVHSSRHIRSSHHQTPQSNGSFPSSSNCHRVQPA